MPQNQTPNPPPAALTPELIKKVADRVYAMLQAELRLEWERRRAQGGRK